MAILVLDVGNTHTKAGLFTGRQVRDVQVLEDNTAPEREAFIDGLIEGNRIEGCMVSSVVRERNRTWQRLLSKKLEAEPLFLHHGMDLGVPMGHPHPETVGPDRLANAAAAAGLFKAPVVAIDIGTAMTMDVVDRKQGYVGGSIAPGPGMFTHYMAERTSGLPLIELTAPKRFIGRSTREAMQIAAHHGYLGMIRELLAGIKLDLGVRKLQVVGTGGFARRYLKALDPAIPVRRDLTLLGLGMVYIKNYEL